MIWIFTRGCAQVDVEIRRAGEAYELVVSYPDGTERIERFQSPARLIRRSLRLQRRLMREAWEPRRRPIFSNAPALSNPPDAGLALRSPVGGRPGWRPAARRPLRLPLLDSVRRQFSRLAAALHL
jgi:hypothetical protein